MPQHTTSVQSLFGKQTIVSTLRAMDRWLMLFLFLFCGSSTIIAEADLSEKSPFLPPGHGEEKVAPKPVAPPSQGRLSREIEFRSVVQIGGTYQFSLFSKKESEGYWIEENETVSGIRVSDFNPDNSTIIVTKNGRSERLPMVSATDSPMPVAVSTTSGKSAQPPKNSPKNAKQKTNASGKKDRRVVPRRRVILPKSK